MKKKFIATLLLSIIGLGMFGLNSDVSAKGRRNHSVSSHTRKITTTKNGSTRTRTVRVRRHRSK